MINILQNGYLTFTGNVAFDFFFSWVGFFTVAAFSFEMIIRIITRFKG